MLPRRCHALTLALPVTLPACERDQDASPPTTAPGTRGAHAAISFHVAVACDLQPNAGDVLACGETRTFAVDAREEVACAGYTGWSALYAEAVRRGDLYVARLSCEGDCVRNPYITRQEAKCGQGGQNPFVRLHHAVTCRGSTEALIDGLALWTPGMVVDGREEELPGFSDLPPPRDVVTSTLQLDREARECPVAFHYQVSIAASTGTMVAVADYQPWIARARVEAESLWEATSCPAACPRRPLVEEFVDWRSTTDASGNVVVSIKSEWSVECRMPG